MRVKFWTSTRSRTVKERLSKAEVPRWSGGVCAEARIFVFSEYNLQRLQNKQEESAEEGEMKQQQRMKIVKDSRKKIRSKGRMDAESRWWVTELLAADCEKAWMHPGWKDTMQKKKMEEMHQQKVTQMTESAEGSAGLLHKITMSTVWRGGAQILVNEEADARLMVRCEAKRK